MSDKAARASHHSFLITHHLEIEKEKGRNFTGLIQSVRSAEQ